MKKVLLGLAVLLAGTALFFGGLFLGQANATDSQVDWMMGSGQRGPRFIGEDGEPIDCHYWNTAGMMNGFGMPGSGFGMMNGEYGMMGSGAGMMGGLGSVSYADVDPLTIEDAEIALAEYLVSLANENLAVGEIMIFDNHAYAQIVDTGTEAGAFEVLVDPVSRNVFPEPGPNMMWNTEYGHMSGRGGHGMMTGTMGGFVPGSEINVTGEEAVTIAQQYLDNYLPGTTADVTVDAFPGYYTIHVLRDGGTSGMLSVNAYTGQVFIHHWHGEFVGMTEDKHE